MKDTTNKSKRGAVSALAEKPKDGVTSELLERVRNWYDGLSAEAKLASILLIELIAHQNELPDRQIGQDIRDRIHAEVIGGGTEDVDFLTGLYATFDSMNC